MDQFDNITCDAERKTEKGKPPQNAAKDERNSKADAARDGMLQKIWNQFYTEHSPTEYNAQ